MSEALTTDQQRAFIDLLDRVAIFAREDSFAYRRVRAQIDRLRAWFADRTGWPVVQRRELIRLVKTPVLTSIGHGLRAVQKPLDYEILTWILWYSETTGSDQFLLTQLVEEIEVRAGELLGSGHLDWNVYGHRLSLNRALKELEAIGVLRRLDGDTEAWAQDRSGNSLYELTPLVRHLYIHLPKEIFSEDGEVARQVDVPTVLNRAAYAPLQETGDARRRLYRTLLLSPALYAMADPEAFALLNSPDHRRRITTDMQGHFGWDLEVTETYACVLRANSSEASEHSLFPFRGALSHVLLMLFGRLQEMVQSGDIEPDVHDRLRLTPFRLTAVVSELKEAYGSGWGKTLGSRSTQAITEQVMEALATWDMVAGPDTDGQIYILPLAARFCGVYHEEE